MRVLRSILAVALTAWLMAACSGYSSPSGTDRTYSPDTTRTGSDSTPYQPY